jgi:hypothetical protein
MKKASAKRLHSKRRAYWTVKTQFTSVFDEQYPRSYQPAGPEKTYQPLYIPTGKVTTKLDASMTAGEHPQWF